MTDELKNKITDIIRTHRYDDSGYLPSADITEKIAEIVGAAIIEAISRAKIFRELLEFFNLEVRSKQEVTDDTETIRKK